MAEEKDVASEAIEFVDSLGKEENEDDEPDYDNYLSIEPKYQVEVFLELGGPTTYLTFTFDSPNPTVDNLSEVTYTTTRFGSENSVYTYMNADAEKLCEYFEPYFEGIFLN